MSRLALIYNDWRGPIIADLLAGGGFTPICLDRRVGADSDSVALPMNAVRVSSVSQALKEVTAVLTVLDSQQEDEDIYMAGGGIFEVAKPGGLFIDLSTTTPRLAKELGALAAVHDHAFVEAPLIGTRAELADSRARILAAGEADSLKQALPILGVIAEEVSLTGLSGNGMAAKLAWQVSLASSLVGLVEALAFAAINGLDKLLMLELLTDEAHPAYSLATEFGKAIIDEDFQAGLDVKSFLSDLDIALEAADEADLPLPGLETCQRLFDLLQLIGDDSRGIQSLALNYYDEANSQRFGLNWSLAQKAMDIYERGSSESPDDYLYDYDDEDDESPGHQHGHGHALSERSAEGSGLDPYGDDSGPEDPLPSIGSYFSEN